jgi:tyrosyl-tRNA synthetase
VEEKIAKVKLVCENGGELIGEEQLRRLFEHKAHPVCYDGFEPSGRMHIAQGVLKAINVNRLTDAGCVFVFWIADWFGLLNNKMGGDLDKIQTVGRYFVEVWKAVGMDMGNVRFLWCADELNKNPNRYWLLVLNIARSNTITRIKKCTQIMGRQEGDDNPSASIMYPCMQCADVFYLGADICQLGKDQRKVNMLAREYLDKKECQERREKPVVASHGMLPGLLKDQEKMSKSDPGSAIFMEDSEQEVKTKINKAYCPPKQVDDNPCLAYVRALVFPKEGVFKMTRSAENGGDVEFATPEALEAAYKAGDVHPRDVKDSLAAAINRMIDPVRQHFATDPAARDLLAKVKSYQVTK